jgi:hypothetical protein
LRKRSTVRLQGAHRYLTDKHVAAALALFPLIATLFWYILRALRTIHRNR